ncbi:KR domain-containing protein [Actinoalloteichus sp. AHMU CJ021]|uniref:Short-chain dehydrogenase n=1 Tax=Actinoalloteichus caeruleus DSM 43889 TaxID=1120930 RepID=A0ABT1JIZ6_ACTCY|nr:MULTISPECIES: SDR family oxidoreductase [Actinoalloteichus]AUS79715.1 KR domain-containing protein [Actinoalloteichus sp. AHMU CJ021]MCP2332472.1 Short-chain dehydrogenase [Actinoalloteichus caeruleus DSM 43889]
MTTWLITGASRGLGRELAEQVLERGDRVAATLREPERLDGLVEEHGDRLWRRQMDVTDTARIEKVLGEAFADHERIDVIVSNAGYGVFGAGEDLTDAQVERVIATNLTGSIQVARRGVPLLRDQGGGVLVQLSSMGGHITFPGFAIYHASKWGVEGYFEALAQEIEPFGIRTVLVEPGMVRTGFYDAAERVPVSEPYRGGPADFPTPKVDGMVGSQSGVAHAIIEAVTSGNPPLRLLLNSDAYDAVTSTVRRRLASLESQRDSSRAADEERTR